MQYYWHIELYSGEIIRVKPDMVKFVQNKINQGDGSIPTPTRSIIVKDIRDFRMSDELYTDQKFIEGAATAFNEPQLNEEGAVLCRWVKKSVPRRQWDNYYKNIPSYKLLASDDSYVTIGFKLPLHQLDYQKVVACEPLEVAALERRI